MDLTPEPSQGGVQVGVTWWQLLEPRLVEGQRRSAGGRIYGHELSIVQEASLAYKNGPRASAGRGGRIVGY